jgi:hypothetical protein
MEDYEKVEFAEVYGLAIANRIGIGNLLAEGTVRFAEKLGRLPADFDTLLRLTAWGYQDHWSMPTVEWCYGNLMDSRDINNHDMSLGRKENLTCEQFVKILANRTTHNEPFWFDYSWNGDRRIKREFIPITKRTLSPGVSIMQRTTRNPFFSVIGHSRICITGTAWTEWDTPRKQNRDFSMSSQEETTPLKTAWKSAGGHGI